MEDDDKTTMAMTPEEINRLVNVAVTSQLKRQLGNLQQTLTQSISEQFEQLRTQQPQASPAVTKPEAGLASEVEELRRKLEQTERRRLETEAKARITANEVKLRSLLADKVAPQSLDLAVGYLTKIKGSVVLDSDTPTFKSSQVIMGQTEDVELGLEEGVKSFMSSEEGRMFLPSTPNNNFRASPAYAGKSSGETTTDKNAEAARLLAELQF